MTFAPPFQFNSRFHPVCVSHPVPGQACNLNHVFPAGVGFALSSAHAHTAERRRPATVGVPVRSASPSGPTDRRRRCFLSPTPRRAHHARCTSYGLCCYASETKKGALPKHPVTDLQTQHAHWQSQPYLATGLSRSAFVLGQARQQQEAAPVRDRNMGRRTRRMGEPKHGARAEPAHLASTG